MPRRGSLEKYNNMSVKYFIPRARRVYPIPAHWNGRSQSQPKTREIHGACFHEIWLLIHDVSYTALHLQTEWDAVGEFLCDRMINDESYIPTVYKKQKAAGKKLVKFCQRLRKTDLSKFSVEKLFKVYKDLEDAWIELDQYNVPPWLFGGDYLHTYLQEQLSETFLVGDEDIATLFTPPIPSFSSNEEKGILEVALKAIYSGCDLEKNIPAIIEREISGLVDAYYWIPFGYDGPALYDREHYLKSIKDVLATKDRRTIEVRIKQLDSYKATVMQKQNVIYAKYKITAPIKRLIEITHTLALMTDERKEFTFPAHEIFHRIITEIAKQLGVKMLHLKYLVLDEIKQFEHDADGLIALAEKRMNSAFIMYWKDGICEIWDEEKTSAFVAQAMPQNDSTEVVKGQIGSRGFQAITTGKIRILLTPAEINKLEDGEILVTAMTTPEYVPAMRRSLAVITDEGGITCHAAIVSRELKIPCVIGTKVATKIFKDGDLVEVDTEKGTVHRIG
jgi:phosphohistidine swiveling domain-containing protein